MDFPIITIVITAYFPEGVDGNKRRVAARMTLKSWSRYIKYAGWLDLVIVHDGPGNDDGTDNIGKFHREALDIWTYPVTHDRVTTMSPLGRGGVGRSLNLGFREAFKTSPLVLYAVDDWALTEPFDLTPWVQLLMERNDVGMVRLGPPHPGTSGVIRAYTDNWQGWALQLERSGYAFGHRPALYHKRMIDTYGWFKEDCSAIDCEKDYVDRVNSNSSGPDVVLALPHPWQHLDSVELAYLDPKGEQ